MRLIQTWSRWGNLYNKRHFVNGKMVSAAEYVAVKRTLERSCAVKRTDEQTSYGYRLVIEEIK